MYIEQLLLSPLCVLIVFVVLIHPFTWSTVVKIWRGNMLGTLCTICKLITSIKLAALRNIIIKTTFSNTVHFSVYYKNRDYAGKSSGEVPPRKSYLDTGHHWKGEWILVGWHPPQPRDRDPVAILKEQKGQPPTILFSPHFSLIPDYYVSGDFTIHLWWL